MFKFLRANKSAAAAKAATGDDAPQSQLTVAGSADTPGPRRDGAEALLRRLEWTVLRRLDGLLQGDYRTLLRGFGLDLADLREYQAHDDVRYIDWNVTARVQIPHVREFQEDREVTAWFLMDLSGSVDFGSQKMRKRELAAELAGVLARVLTRHGNRVGALLHGRSGKADDEQVKDRQVQDRRADGKQGKPSDTREEILPVRGGRPQVLHLMDRILAMQSETPKAGGSTTDLGALLKQAHQIIKRRSVIFVVSDFISTPGWEQGLSLLARRHEVIAVRLYDPMELELPPLGLVVLQDAETGEQVFVDTHDTGFRKRFAEQAKAREEHLRDSLGRAGVDCLELATDADLAQSLLAFIELRKRRSRLSAGGGMHASRVAELRG